MPQPAQPTQANENQMLLIIIAVLLPWAAVLVMRGCTAEVLICFLLSCLFYLPGLLYALYLIFHSDANDTYIEINKRSQYGPQPATQMQQQPYQQDPPPQAFQDRPYYNGSAPVGTKEEQAVRVESLDSAPTLGADEKKPLV